METPSGSLFIPSRAVDVAKRKPVSRNTHYWLTDEEACKVGQDPRVMFVELTPEERGISFKLTAVTQTSTEWNKSKSINNQQHNWGLLRSTEGTQRPNWGKDGTTTVSGTINLAYTRGTVDVVIADGHFLNTHPEFAVNADGSGGSRFVAYNWYQNNATVTGGAPGTYDYSSTLYNFHATHTAGIAAGNTHGWARGANIYNISIFEIDPNYLFNYIKVFHQSKAVNIATGRKNPTVVNCSFETAFNGGFLRTWNEITQVVYRGTTYNGPFTRAQLEGYSFVFDASGRWIPPTQTSSYNVDMLDAIGAGVIVCAAAGNTWQKVAEVNDLDWNNSCVIDGTTIYYNRGSFAAPTGGGNRAIIVGGVSDKTAEYKLFMSATGPRVDIYSPAESINSSYPISSNPYNDPAWYAYEPANPVLDSRGIGYNFKLSGTSMASPQVAGVIAVLMEINYSWTPAQALAYIQTTAGLGQLGEITDPASQYNLKGATNRYLYYSTNGSGPGGGVVTPTYAVAGSASSVNEGGTVTYNITTTDVANGTTLYWTNSGNTNAADFTDNSNSGSFTISSNSGSFTRTLRNDLTTEGAETVVIQIRTTALTGAVVATASSVTVNDTSTTPTQPTVAGQVLSPTIFSPIPNYLYDPISGNYNLPPGNGNWASSTRWQGPNPGTLVQTQTNLFTSDIDTNLLPFRDAGGSLGPYNTVAYINPTGTIQRPFGDYLEISFGASIDNWYYSNGGVAQLNAYAYLKDPDGNFFVMFFSIYDSRPEYYNYAPNVGGGGAVVFASTPVGNTKYCTSNNTMVTLSTVGGGFINYTLRFTKTHFATALADVTATGATTNWPAPSDWLIYEVGLTHQVIHFNDPGTFVHSTVSFTSPLVAKTTQPYPTNIIFTQGYPAWTTMLNGIQCTPDAYDIQSTEANGRNVGAGVMTVRFDWRSHRYWEFNPDAHCAFILRASENHVRGNVITDPGTGKHVRGNQGTGLLFGNLSGYNNPSTGHVGNPIHPSTIIETWYQPNGYGNDLLPGSWGTMVLQDDVTYQTEINAIIDSNGRSFVSYKLVSGGIIIFDCPPIADNNTYYNPTNTGLIIGQVFGSGNNDPADPWSINLSNLSVTWSANTAGFTITPDKTTVNEGDTITWTVTTTNIPDGTVLYWTRSGTTEGQDFSDAVISPYDGYSGVVTINNNVGTFSRTASLDNLTEGTETAIMSIRQGSQYGTIEATAATVYILDTSISTPGEIWAVTPDKTTANEGETVTWTVTTTNVANGTYYWTNSGSTDGQDFTDVVIGPSDGLSGSFTITSGSGSFTRTLSNDLKTEGSETIIMNIRKDSTIGPIVRTSVTVTVNDTSTTPVSTPAYSVAPDRDVVIEGGIVRWNIITANVANGTTLYWTNSGTTDSDDFSDTVVGPSNTMSGAFTINAGSGFFTRSITIDAKLEGTETIVMNIRTGSTSGPIVATAATVSVLDTSIPAVPTYIAIPNKTTVDEGGVVTWTVNTTAVTDGTRLYWTNVGSTDNADFNDFVVGPSDTLSGSFVITSNVGSFSRSIIRDNKTEGTETIVMKIKTGSIVGPVVYTSPTVYVNDTSLSPPVYNVTPNQRLVKEGGVVVYTVNTENVPLNTTLFWTTDGIGTTTNADDFVDYVNSGTVVITSAELGLSKAHGRITRRLLKDNIKEGVEAMVLRIRRGSTDGPIVTATSVVTVIDTSRTPIVNWISTGSLGTLLPGQISELYVKASFNTSPVYPKYAVTGGTLPAGLIMSRDGTISGQVTVDTSRTSFTETSTFVVSVIDPNNKSLLNGQFSITVKQTEKINRTDIYCRPFLSQDKRDSFRSLIRSETVFPTNMLYRSFDPNFGRQEDLTVYLDFGVEKLTYEQYANITSTNFYKRTLSIGEIKIAVAKNTDATVRYEFIYLDVIDKHVNSNKISMPLEFTFNGVTYYPPSIPNMRSRIAESSTISTVRYPSFTNYVQNGDAVKLGYIPFIPLCYCLPGKSATIIRKISESGFKFNTINFELDRIVVKDVLNETGAKYLLLSRDTKLA